MFAATATIISENKTNGAPIEISQGIIVNQCGISMPAWKDQKLTAEIESISSMGEQHRQKLRQAAADFRSLMKDEFPDASIWMTGSFAAGVDLPSSDLDFTIRVPSLGENRDNFNKLMAIKRNLWDSDLFYDLYVTGGLIPVLTMVHKATRVDLDVTIDNDPPKSNTLLLSVYGQLDERFPKLCRGVKKWATDTGVENSKMGRVNSFSVCLLLVHFLQQVGVLPKELPSTIRGTIELGRDAKEEIGWVSRNKDSLGALFWGFMKYYSQFDFKNQWISIRQGKALEKRRDENGEPLDGLPKNNSLIVVEDPFLVPAFNCARTLRQDDIYHRILEEFVEAEKTIREKSRFPIQKSTERVKVENEGKLIDCRITEIEDTLDDLSWDDLVLLKRVIRARPGSFWGSPGSFWNVKLEEKQWPDIVRFQSTNR
uniref:PAP-associated domain-containing protein n=1 Tax=Caenorhabditis tropicalis TaxID=1561998 RepID=A0A1I7TJ90_9PELO